MTRVKRGTIKNKRRRNLLKRTKGYRFGRSTKERSAREAFMHAGANAFAHRRKKKGDFRRLWQIRINAGARANGVSYSDLMGKLRQKGIQLDRKTLATLAQSNPETFARIVAKAKE